MNLIDNNMVNGELDNKQFEQSIEYMISSKQSAPRLPNIFDNSLVNNINEIQNTLSYYISQCKINDKYNNEIMIYDNNSNSKLILYVSCKNEIIHDEINQILEKYKTSINDNLKTSINNLKNGVEGGSEFLYKLYKKYYRENLNF